jgi:peroxiredoxin
MRIARVALACALALSGTAARAEENAAAAQLYKSVMRATRAARTLRARLTLDAVVDGKTIHGAGPVRAMKPNYARIDIESGGVAKKTYASDGKWIWRRLPDATYQRSNAKPDGSNLASWEALAPALFLQPDLRKLGLAGFSLRGQASETASGAGRRALLFASSGRDRAQLKLYVGPQNIVVGSLYTSGSGKRGLRVLSMLSGVKLNEPMRAASFRYTPLSIEIADDAPAGPHALEGNLLPVHGTAPLFNLPAAAGGSIGLNETLRGSRAVIVSFWFTACPQCKEEFPRLQELYVRLKAKGLGLVAIDAGDERRDVLAYAGQHGLTFPIAMGGPLKKSPKTIFNRYGVQAFPTTYVLDPTGRIIWRSLGWDPAGLNRALKRLGVQ